ncbi:hypothetical protein BKA66DRAFT_459540 [Pyrenochaeta sp. MPI-SDFR-AT-0127]|nr:hypothetical protein BKA66DRAFT_459540 [Pyrenochaeta sp. MPI-SDFR-AT-0127]
MGSSSSQPVPDPSKSPKMDDLAASQQLIAEDARVQLTPGSDEGASQTNIDESIEPSTPTRKRRRSDVARKSKGPSMSQAGVSIASPKNFLPTPLRSFALSDIQAYAESDEWPEASSGWPVSPLKIHAHHDRVAPTEVEVPDSQQEPSITHTALSPPMTSSMTVPMSVSPKKRTHKTGRRRMRTEVDLNNILPEQQDINGDEDRTIDASHKAIASPLRSKRRRRQSIIISPAQNEVEPMHVADEQNSVEVLRRNLRSQTEKDFRTPTTLSKKPRRAPKSRAAEVSKTGDTSAASHIVNGQSQRSGTVLLPPKKTKPHSARLVVELDSNDNSGDEEASRLEAEHSSALDTETVNSATEKRVRNNNKNETRVDVVEQAAPVRNVDQPIVEPGKTRDNDEVDRIGNVDQDEVDSPSLRVRKQIPLSERGQASSTSEQNIGSFVPPETSSVEDAIPSVPQGDIRASSKKRQYKKGRKPPRPSEKRSHSRKSHVDPKNSMTAAERSLSTIRELHQPPNLRMGGDFTQDEEELIRRAIRDFQERKGLDTFELVEIIQWTDDTKDNNIARRKSDWVTQEAQEEQESNEFWEEIKNVNLTRKLEAVRNHIRSQYHTFKIGGWTKKEDEQLMNLYELHPKRWKLISQVLGDRSMHDVHNRWRDYAQYGETRNTSTWSLDEEHLLVRAVTTVAQRDEDFRAKTGKPPLTEYMNKDINWMQVCAEMGNIRSRLQSSVKWTKMKARDPPPQILLDIKPRGTCYSDQDTELAVEYTSKPPGGPRKSDAHYTPQSLRKRGRPRKSEKDRAAGIRGEKTKKRRNPKKSVLTSQELADEQRHRSGSGGATLSPRRSITNGMPSGAQMLWGDKFDLVEAIINHGKESEGNVDWHDVATVMPQSWSIQTLQSTQQELFEIVKDKGMVEDGAPFDDIIFAVLRFLEDEHGEELAEHYDPHIEADFAGDLEPVDTEMQEGTLENLPNTKRKRKRGARESVSRSGSASVKRKKTQPRARPSALARYKSNHLVTESDDAQSEPEP